MTIHGNATPLKGVTQLGIRHRIGEIPPGGRPQSSGGSSGGQKSSGDVDIEGSRNQQGRVGGEQMGGGDGQSTRQAKTALQQPRLKRKRVQEETHSDKDGEIVDRGEGRRVRKRGGSDGGGADRRRKSAVVSNEGEVSEDGLNDLDNDLDDLERELEGMDSDEDSIKIGRGQQACEADEGESEAEDDANSDESDGSIGAATLEIERFLEFVKGDADGGDARVVKKRRAAAAGADNLRQSTRQAKTALQQPRLKRKRAQEETHSDKDGEIVDRGEGRRVRKRGGSDGGGADRRRKSAVVSSEGAAAKSEGEVSEDDLNDLDDDLDDLERELEGMDSDEDSIKIGRGQQAWEADEGESEAEDDAESDESDGSIGAATLEIERFLEFVKGDADGGDARVVKKRRAAAAGADNLRQSTRQAKTALRQPRLKRKRAQEETHSDKGGEIVNRGEGRRVLKRRGSDGGGADRRRKSAVVSSEGAAAKSEGEVSEDDLNDLDDDLDDLERELEGMDSDEDSIKIARGQQACEADEGESEAEDDSKGDESDGSIGAATLEIERFLEFVKGDADGGDARVAKKLRTSAAGADNLRMGNGARSQVGASDEASEEDSASGDNGYGSGLRQGTMRPVHDKGTSRKSERDKGVGRDKDGQGSDGEGREGEGREDERSEPEKRRAGGTNSVAAEPLGCPQTNNEGQGEEENVDSDLERDFDEMLEKDDGASDLDLDHEILRAKSKGNGEGREVERGSGANAFGSEEEDEDVSSYSEEESGDEDASEEDSASGDNGYGSGLRQGTMRSVHDKGVGRDKDGQGSDGEGKEDGLNDLDDDLDDLEKELEGMDSHKDSIKIGSGQQACEADGGESEAKDDSESDESDGSIGAATLEIERFLEFVKGDADGGDARIAKNRRTAAAGADNLRIENGTRSQVGASDEASEEDSASGDNGYGSGLRQGTMRPMHDKGTSRKSERDKGVGRDKDGQGRDGEGREDERSEPEKRRAGGTNSVAPEPLGCPQTNNEGQGEEENVDSDLERDFDEILEEDDEANDLDLGHKILRAKSKGNGKVREVERGSGANASGSDEEYEDVSSYSEEESGDEDASEEDSASGDNGYVSGLRQGTMRPVHEKGTSRKSKRVKGVGRDKGSQGSDGEGREDERSEPEKRRAGGTNSVAPEPLGCPQTNNERQGEEENVDSDLERDFDEMLEEDDGASNLDLDHEILRAKSKSNGKVREDGRGSGASASGSEEEDEDVSSYSEEESGDEDVIEDIEDFLAQM